jgi:sulfate permease, SulP family
MWQTLKFYCNPNDGRYEDLAKGTWYLNVFRDFTAGLIVAMIAIPLAMGLAIASGLKPEMGIIGGAIAALVGAIFGGSKYQVYGPTAAFIPIILGLMTKYDSHAFLVLASLISGFVLVGFGLARLGRIVNLVPHSIVVGFTIGIAVVIGMSQAGEMLGLPEKLKYGFLDKVVGIYNQIGSINWYALAIGMVTFIVVKVLIKISVYIPGPVVALGVAVFLSTNIWYDKGLVLIKDRYGEIPTNLFLFTGPSMPEPTWQVILDLAYYVIAIIFVSGVESLLCSRMADRLAENEGTPYNPDKELWGQGWVQIIVPLLNGFPHTGALARTAANIKLGAVSPLAGIFKCVLKLILAYYMASFLGTVPMACIGGLLLYVATGMVKPAEVTQVFHHNKFHIALMVWTAIMVIATDFLIGVLSAIFLYAVLHKFLDSKTAPLLADGSTAADSGTNAMPEPVEVK